MNSTLGLIPAASTSGPHACGICAKVFERRDLRDRHKRRCEQSIGKPRRTRQKSCLSCAASKQKCDLSAPSCLRCLERYIYCEYPARTQRSSNTPNGESNHEAAEPIQLQDTSTDRPRIAANKDATLMMEENQNTKRIRTSQDSSSFTFSDGAMIDGREPVSSTVTTDRLQLQSYDELDSQRSPARDDIFGSRPLDDSSSFTTQDLWPIVTDNADATVDEYFRIQHYPQYFERENGFSLLDTLGIPGIEVNPNEVYHAQERDGMPILAAEPQAFSSKDNRNRSRSARTSEGPSIMTIDAASLGDRASSRMLPIISGEQTHSAFKLDDDEKTVNILCDYPKVLLRKDSQSPFIHHTFYRIAQSDVPEPLAIALCCISAYANVTKHSADFTCKMISAEVDRLVTVFHSSSSSDIDSLATVHAMCAYQILGILDLARPLGTSKIKRAELHHPFFIKMARHLCKLDSQWQLNAHQVNTWNSWALAETFRRTIFMVNIINVISQRVGALNRNYSEPLDDHLILDLQMPAPDEMWTASSCEEWEVAKTAAGVAATPKTLREFLAGLSLEADSDGLPDFTRMIISSAWKATPTPKD